MSILASLKRLFDPIAHRQEQAEFKRKSEAPRPHEKARAEPLTCRICRYVGEEELCPHCLAGTMERKP